MLEKVGFIGLGDIGLPMAKRVVTNGYEVAVCCHRRREPVEEMKNLGAKEAKTTKEVAEASEVIIAMLRDDIDTGDLIFGSGGVMEGARKGTDIIMMSTLSPAFCRKVGEAGKAKGIGVLEAPVTGARIRAATGELGIMVGGEKELMEKQRHLLETMGTIIYCGDLGTGQIVKLANNMALMINTQAAYEAISWGIRNGADEQLLVDLMKMGTGTSWAVQNWELVKSVNVDPPPPHYYLGTKDLDYALRIAHDTKTPCPLTALCLEWYLAGVPKLPIKKDIS